MRSGSKFVVSRSWWAKERPDGLGAEGDALASALEDVAKAGKAMRKPNEEDVAAFTDALDRLAAAGVGVAAKAKSLLRDAQGDAARVKHLKNTISAIGRPLQREISAGRAQSADALAELADDEADDGDVLASAEAQAAYIRKLSQKIKKVPHKFALGLPSNDPADMRFLLHRKRGGRALVSRLKRGMKVRRFTFGTIGSARLASDLGDDSVGARTLVLYVEGRRIPSLAKRVRMMLRRLGVSTFSRVKVFVEGQEIESADETSDDLLDGFDNADMRRETDSRTPSRTAARAADARGMASEAAARLRRRLGVVKSRVFAMPLADSQTLRRAVLETKARLEDGALGSAERMIGQLEHMLDGVGANAGAAAPSSQADLHPEKTLRRLKANFGQLARKAGTHIRRHPDAKAELLPALKAARAAIDAGDAGQAAAQTIEAARLLKKLSRTEA